MATGKVIGQIQVTQGNIKIIGVDGVVREPAYDGLLYAGEQIVSVDSDALFQIKYSALPEATAYDGIFRVLADGSVIAGADAMDSIMSDKSLTDVFDIETAAGEEGAEGSSAFTPTNIVAESSVLGFGRGENQGVSGADGLEGSKLFSDDLNDFAPTAEDAGNSAMEDNPANVYGQLSGSDSDGNAFTFVLLEGPLEGSLILNPNGSYIYNVGGDFQDLGVGETRDVTFTYKTVEATTPEGYESEPATVTITVSGTNDQPVVTDINANGNTWLIGASTIEQGEGETGYYDTTGASEEEINALFNVGEGSVTVSDLFDSEDDDINPTDGAAMKLTISVNAGEAVTFNWIFNDAEGYNGAPDYNGDGIIDDGYNDFAFVVIDGQSIELLANTYEEGNTNSGTFTYTFEDAGQHEITFGVMNDDDDVVDSSLQIFHISGGIIVGTESVGYVENIGGGTIYETHDTDQGADGDTIDDVDNVFTGALEVSDDDVNDEHTFEVVEGSVAINGESVSDELATIYFNESTQSWEYKIQGNFNYLAANESATVTFSYIAIDDSGVGAGDEFNESSVSESKTVTLTITGTNDQPIVSNMTVSVYESHDNDAYQNGEDDTQDDVLTTFEGNLATVQDDDVNDTHEYFLAEETTAVASDAMDAALITDLSVAIDPETGDYAVSGNFNALAAAETATVTFDYYAVDSSGETNESSVSEPKTVTLTITGTNDQPIVTDISANGEGLNGLTTFTNETDHPIYDYHATQSTIEITESGTVEDLNVQINLGHSFDGDLNIFLIAPDGTHIGLSAYHGGGGNNYSNTIFDDEGGVPISSGYAPFAGIFIPDTPLSVIDSMNIQGIWTLQINDDAGWDSGTLFSWSLHATVDGETVVYESHDNDAYQNGEDDTQDDVLTTFEGNLATVTDDDVNDTHEYFLAEETTAVTSDAMDAALITDLSVVIDSETGDYTVSGNFNALAAAETATVTFNYYAVDSSESTDESSVSEPKTVTLTITGTNDQPIVSNMTVSVYESHDNDAYQNGEDDTQDDVMTVFTNTLAVQDDDVNDEHTFEVVEGSVAIDGESVADDLVTIYFNDDSGHWEYKVEGDFNYLNVNENAVVTFDYIAIDNSGVESEDETNESSVSEPKTVTLTITGTNDQPIIENIEESEVFETELNSVTYGANVDVDFSEIVPNPQEGSAVKFVVDTSAGETVSFDWVFDLRDWDYMQDSAFVVVDGSVDANGNFSFTFESAGEHTIVFGVLNNNENQGFGGSSLLTVSNIAGGILISSNLFGAVTGNSVDGYSLSANSNFPISELEAFIDLQETTYENAHLSGSLEEIVSVGDDDNDDGYSYVPFNDMVVDFVENTSGGEPIITTPIRVTLDADGNYDIVSSSFDKLGENESVVITFNVQVQDESGVVAGNENNETSYSEIKTVTVVINGTNDSPVIESVTANSVMETDLNDVHAWFVTLENSLLFQGSLTEIVSDEDINDDYSYVEMGQSMWDPAFANVVDVNNVIQGPTFIKVDSDGTYSVYNPTFNNLGAGEEVTVSFDIQVTDGTNDANGEPAISNTQTVTFTISGTNDQPVVINRNIERHESYGDGETTLSGHFVGWDEDTNDALAYNVVTMDRNELVTNIAGAGFERVMNVPYDSDGNDAYEGSVDIAVKLASGSEIDLSDIDITGIKVSGDHFTLEGDFNALPRSEVLTIKFLYNANDGSLSDGTNGYDETAISDVKMVKITVAGTNDIAQINVPMGQDSGEVAEDMIYTVDGQLDISDLDAGENEFSTVVEADSSNTTSYGTFTIDASGAWLYTLNNSNNAVQELNSGQLVIEKYIVSSEDGTASQTIEIIIHGADEPNVVPVIEVGQIYTVNETLIDVGRVVATDADSDALTYTLVANAAGDTLNPANTIFEIDSVTGVIGTKNGETLDYEDNPLHTIYVKVTDGNGAYDIESVQVNVNDITGDIRTVEGSVALQTFDGSYNEGWTGAGNEEIFGDGKLGWFNSNSDTRTQTFDLSASAGESVSLDVDLKITSGFPPYNGWEGNDNFIVRVTDSNDNEIITQTYSPNGVGTIPISFDFDIPDNGIITVKFQSENIDETFPNAEYWSIDNFSITGSQGQQILSFDSSTGGTIDVEALVNQANDFEGDTPNSIDEIDLSTGNYTLSNITLSDVISMTDSDNVLKITGDMSDGVNNIAANGWVPDTSSTAVTEVGYDTYTNIANSSVQLLIDVDIQINTI